MNENGMTQNKQQSMYTYLPIHIVVSRGCVPVCGYSCFSFFPFNKLHALLLAAQK